MTSYLLAITDYKDVQHPDDTCFIGGHPRLPAEVELPACELCGALQTFYFQVAFPPDHIWGGYSLAVFACIACHSNWHSVPAMLSGRKKPLNIPTDFFEDYQRNFRFCVFPTERGQVRHDYEPRVSFYRWRLLPMEHDFGADDEDRDSNKVGGQPGWMQFDGAPTTYNGSTPMHFLMQIEEDFEFEIVIGAPPQKMEKPGYDEWFFLDYYLLFLGNASYFYGIPKPDERLIYVVVQH
jgi:hypothetical protein